MSRSRASESSFSAARQRVVLAIAAGLLLSTAAQAAAGGWVSPHYRSRAEMPRPGELDAGIPKASTTDPMGDTFGVGPVQLDVVGFSADAMGGELVLTLTFANTITPPDSGNDNAVDGFIDIDVDQNANTGSASNVDFFRPGMGSTNLGVEAFVDLFTYSAVDGAADLVIEPLGPNIDRVPLTFTSNSFTVRIPLTVLNDDGAVNTAAVLGTFEEPTDIVPDQGFLASEGDPGTPMDTVFTLRDERFEVTVQWTDFNGDSGSAQLVDQSNDSLLLYFFEANNWEFLLKVLDGCNFNGHYWVFFAATTDVEFEVTVTDTLHDLTRRYTNPLGNAADTVNDTFAFSTCP